MFCRICRVSEGRDKNRRLFTAGSVIESAVGGLSASFVAADVYGANVPKLGLVVVAGAPAGGAALEVRTVLASVEPQTDCPLAKLGDEVVLELMSLGREEERENEFKAKIFYR